MPFDPRRLPHNPRAPNTDVKPLADNDDDRPPICPACGVTMLPAELSAHARAAPDDVWVCLECEEVPAD